MVVTVVEADGQCFVIPPATLEGRPCATAPDEVRRSIRWTLAVPVAGDYDNPGHCRGLPADGCHDPVRYREEELIGLRGRFDFDAAQDPGLSAPGSHRLAVRLVWRGSTLSFPATLAGEVDDGVAADLLEVVVRRGDDYVGLLTELLGVPFSLGPVRLAGIGHQTDRRLAADCVALVIYGRRRLGEHVPYVAPPLLRERLERIGSAPSLVDEAGAVADVGHVRAGDVLHFGFQTAVLSRDGPPVGRLDGDDLVIHTYHGVAEEVALGRLPYRGHAVEVLRWPSQPKASGIPDAVSVVESATAR